MSTKRSLPEVVDRLIDEGRLAGDRAERATAFVDQQSPQQPWYVRLMVGFGAWLASLLVVGFVAGITIAAGGVTLVGLGLVAAAVVLRWQSGNDFMVQATLAASLSGQVLLAYGVADSIGSNEIEWVCSTVILVNGLLFVIFPDRIHRALSVLFAGCALVALLYQQELKAWVPILGPLITAALIGLQRHHPRLVADGRGHLLGPLETGLMLVAFGCLLLSAVYVMPELGAPEIYPRPWLSTLLLAPLFLYVGAGALPPLLADAPVTARPLAYLLMAGLIVAAWNAPGLLLALTIMLIGASSGQRFFIGAGIAFFAIFLTAWFYGIEVSLLAKSITLIASGTIILLVRRVLLAQLAPGGTPHD